MRCGEDVWMKISCGSHPPTRRISVHTYTEGERERDAQNKKRTKRQEKGSANNARACMSNSDTTRRHKGARKTERWKG